jgi:hypothetical protein
MKRQCWLGKREESLFGKIKGDGAVKIGHIRVSLSYISLFLIAAEPQEEGDQTAAYPGKSTVGNRRKDLPIYHICTKQICNILQYMT